MDCDECGHYKAIKCEICKIQLGICDICVQHYDFIELCKCNQYSYLCGTCIEDTQRKCTQCDDSICTCCEIAIGDDIFCDNCAYLKFLQ